MSPSKFRIASICQEPGSAPSSRNRKQKEIRTSSVDGVKCLIAFKFSNDRLLSSRTRTASLTARCGILSLASMMAMFCALASPRTVVGCFLPVAAVGFGAAWAGAPIAKSRSRSAKSSGDEGREAQIEVETDVGASFVQKKG
mgnify:FL=1